MAFGGSTKRLFIQIGLDIGRAIHPLNVLKNGFNLLRSTLVATFRTSAIGGFFAVMRAGFQTITNIQQSVSKLVGEMAQLQLAAIATAAVASEGGSGFSSAFEQAANTARTLSTEVAFTAGEIQSGLFTAAQAGYDLNQSLGFTRSAMMLAATAGEDFKTVMNDTIGITRAFGISIEQVPQMADAIAGAAQKSKVSVQGLFEGLRNVASVANVAFGETKDTFIDMTAALMTLNDAGLENSQAGTKMRAALQQLNSGTSKTLAVFAKYGINIYKADAANQGYLETLTKAQKASADYEEELNKLKKQQFDLILAGQQGSKEYDNISEKIQAVTSTLGDLDKGMGDVEQQFKLAGGQMKPFHALLKELQKAPKEAIGRAFGIRGGEPILRILQDMKEFDKNRESVSRFWEESAKGISILQNVYNQFLGSIAMRWQIMKNEVIGIFSVIADAAFGAFGKLFDPIEMGLKALFTSIQDNKDIFRAIFEGVAQLLSPITAQIGIVFARIANMMEEIFMPNARVTLPISTYNQENGKIEQVDKTLGGDSTVAEKLALAMESAVSVLTSGLQAALKSLDPFIQALGKPFADGLSAFLFAKTSIFIKLGAFVATGFIETFKLAMSQYLPKIMSFIGTELSKISFAGLHFGVDSAQGGNGKSSNWVGPALASGLSTEAISKIMSTQGEVTTPVAEKKNTAIEDAMMAGYDSFNTPYGAFGVDMNELNKVNAVSQQAASDLTGAGDKLVDTLTVVANAASKLNQKVESIQRSSSMKDIKGI